LILSYFVRDRLNLGGGDRRGAIHILWLLVAEGDQ
jgi:hypothetical protein